MEPGRRILGKYQLLSLLGQGGMGAVWCAHDLDLNAAVAVKLLDPLLAASSEGLARFHREAQAAAALRSPHVVQILERGVDEATQQPFIVMELMEGESLRERLAREGRLDPETTTRVITHIARALTRAHAAGIVHRDLKPDNVFLVRNEDDELAKVLDFGVAKFEQHRLGVSSETRTGAVIGTPYYMSPEQISGSKQVDFRTDIWALGVIACECITGQRPFTADTHGGLALKICADPMPRPSKLGPTPAGFDAWFERCVAREPERRFESARVAADELRRIPGVTAAVAPVKATSRPGSSELLHTSSADPLTHTARPAQASTGHGARGTRIFVGGGTLLLLAASVLWNRFGRLEHLARPTNPESAVSVLAALPVPPPSSQLSAASVPSPLPSTAPRVVPLAPGTEPEDATANQGRTTGNARLDAIPAASNPGRKTGSAARTRPTLSGSKTAPAEAREAQIAVDGLSEPAASSKLRPPKGPSGIGTALNTRE